jgi:hypothetical protein
MSTRRLTAIAAIAAAAALLAGGGATALASQRTAAATTRATAATGFTWHPLHLLGGWTAARPSVFGTPAYAVSNGVVYLRGIIKGRPGATEFAFLPPGARPAHLLWIGYLGSGDGALGQMAIDPDGLMIALSHGGNGNPPMAPSLDGISFPLSS